MLPHWITNLFCSLKGNRSFQKQAPQQQPEARREAQDSSAIATLLLRAAKCRGQRRKPGSEIEVMIPPEASHLTARDIRTHIVQMENGKYPLAQDTYTTRRGATWVKFQNV